jgi:hypothetical protein
MRVTAIAGRRSRIEFEKTEQVQNSQSYPGRRSSSSAGAASGLEHVATVEGTHGDARPEYAN